MTSAATSKAATRERCRRRSYWRWVTYRCHRSRRSALAASTGAARYRRPPNAWVALLGLAVQDGKKPVAQTGFRRTAGGDARTWPSSRRSKEKSIRGRRRRDRESPYPRVKMSKIRRDSSMPKNSTVSGDICGRQAGFGRLLVSRARQPGRLNASQALGTLSPSRERKEKCTLETDDYGSGTTPIPYGSRQKSVEIYQCANAQPLAAEMFIFEVGGTMVVSPDAKICRW